VEKGQEVREWLPFRHPGFIYLWDILSPPISGQIVTGKKKESQASVLKTNQEGI
jgi:hypothetical protein